MSAVIEISDVDFSGFELTAYFPSRYFSGDDFDFDKLDKDCFLKVDRFSNLLLSKMSKTNEGTPFICLNAKSIFADAGGITSNVEVRITRSFSVFGWIGFGFISTYRYLKGLL